MGTEFAAREAVAVGSVLAIDFTWQVGKFRRATVPPVLWRFFQAANLPVLPPENMTVEIALSKRMGVGIKK